MPIASVYCLAMRLGVLVAILGEVPVPRENACAPRETRQEELPAALATAEPPAPRRSSFRGLRLPAVTRS
jgi:hypothetical protein